MLIVGTIKNYDELKGSGLSNIKERIFTHVRESGHVVNPQKAYFGFGFAEYRQTHCLRGSIIPKDLITIISSEKVKNIIDVQSVLVSLKATLMTKISRGFSVKLARQIYMYIAITLGKVSFKRFRFNKGMASYNSFLRTDTAPKEDDVNREFIVPKWMWFYLPQSMHGLNLHPASFLLSNTESEIGFLLEYLKEHEKEILICINLSSKFKWYTIEADDQHVQGIHKNIDKRFLNSLIPEMTQKVQFYTREMKQEVWWDDIPKQMINRAVLMEQSLLSRDFALSEKKVADVAKEISRESEQIRKDMQNGLVTRRLEIIDRILQGSGFIYGYDFIIEGLEEGEIHELYEIPMDLFLDSEALFLRLGFGYGEINLQFIGCKSLITRLIARDPIMRNVITAEGLLRKIAEFDLDMYQLDRMRVILIGLGFNPEVAHSVAEGLVTTLEFGGLLMIRDNGLLADEFTMSLGSRSADYHNKIQFMCRMSPEEKTSIRLAIFCRELIFYLRVGKKFKNVRVTKKNVGKDAINASLYLSRKRNMIRPSKRLSNRAEILIANALTS